MPLAKGAAKESERDKNISQQAREIQPNKEQRDVVTKMLVRLLKLQEKPDDTADVAASDGFGKPTTQLLQRQEQFSQAQTEHRESTRGAFPWRSANQGITNVFFCSHCQFGSVSTMPKFVLVGDVEKSYEFLVVERVTAMPRRYRGKTQWNYL